MTRLPVFFFTMLALCLAFMSLPSQARDKTDTVEDVMKAGTATLNKLDNMVRELEGRVNGSDEKTKDRLSKQMSALRKLRPLIVRLAQDRAFGARVLEPSLKNDRAGLGEILKRETPGLGFEVQEIRDWSVYAIVVLSRYEKYELCIGSDCKGGGFFNQI